MSRKRSAVKRQVNPDLKYYDRLVNKLITILMMQGKKSIAEYIVYSAFDLIKSRTNKDPVKIFKAAFTRIKPKVEVRSCLVDGVNLQVPDEVRSDRRLTLSLRWLRDCSRARAEKTISERLASEILEASVGLGGSVKKCEDIYRVAEANKAFSYYGGE